VRRRTLAIALVVAVAAAGVVLAIALGGDDDDGEERAATAEPTTATTETETRETRPTETVAPPPRRDDPRDVRAAQRTVTTLVEATEQGDGPRACAVLAGARGEDLEACAAAVGIDLRTLPTSDGFSIDAVDLSGSRGQVRLTGGGTFFVQRLEGGWKVIRFSPPMP
jgi:hypothetical protein